ncbi:hypothetical protein ACPRNU_17705 [Chromobacterium vaccinii]|uniref:hypothetical protein n=1 Tax=Chromobacterium vaccinii TaxID=1108595 RepID=UPI003C774FB9
MKSAIRTILSLTSSGVYALKTASRREIGKPAPISMRTSGTSIGQPPRGNN